MGTVYKITGKNSTDDTEYATLDEARAAIREGYLGKEGTWEEDTTAKGDFKVAFVDKKGKTSWTIKSSEVAEA